MFANILKYSVIAVITVVAIASAAMVLTGIALYTTILAWVSWGNQGFYIVGGCWLFACLLFSLWTFRLKA